MHHLRDTIIVLVILIASVVIGGLLYLFGPSIFHQQSSAPTTARDGYTILVQGQTATAIDTRVNYRITDADQFSQLWDMVYGQNGPSVPFIDFSSQEILAIFDGTHTTSGYNIAVASITTENGQRVVHIVRTVPGTTCTVTSDLTSPFQIIELPKSNIPYTHTDESIVAPCS